MRAEARLDWGLMTDMSPDTTSRDSMIRDIFLDMPAVEMPNRPEGMVAFMRSEVPDEYKPMVDEWVQARGGEVVVIPLIQVHGGKSPAASPDADGY